MKYLRKNILRIEDNKKKIFMKYIHFFITRFVQLLIKKLLRIN
jgi:hypothetical protein